MLQILHTLKLIKNVPVPNKNKIWLLSIHLSITVIVVWLLGGGGLGWLLRLFSKYTYLRSNLGHLSIVLKRKSVQPCSPWNGNKERSVDPKPSCLTKLLKWGMKCAMKIVPTFVSFTVIETFFVCLICIKNSVINFAVYVFRQSKRIRGWEEQWGDEGV